LEKIFKTHIFVNEIKDANWKGDSPGGELMDTIIFQGMPWLVPEWIGNQDSGMSMPTRIICLGDLQYQIVPDRHKLGDSAPFPGIDYILFGPIPRAVLNGQIPKEMKDKYVIIQRPGVSYPSELCDS